MKPLKSSMVKAQGAMMFIGLLATITSIGIAAWGVLGGR